MSNTMPNMPSARPWLKTSVIEQEELSRAAHCGTLYAVIDACCSPGIQARLAEVDEQRGLYRCLYRGNAARNFAGQAPYLIAVHHSQLNWIRSELWEMPWGVFVRSHQSLSQLYVHLRKFLTVEAPGGERWLFRYYDPRILSPFLAACSPEELEDFFGGLDAFVVARANAPVEEYQRARVALDSSAPPRPVGGYFHLREVHLAALRSPVNTQVPDGLLRALRERGHVVDKEPVSGDLVGHDARGFTTRLCFGSDHLPSRLVLPSGATLRFENDPASRVKALTLPGGERLELEYDARGQLTVARQPDRATYKFEYISQNLLGAIHYPDGTREQMQYTEDGQLSVRTGRAGDIWRYVYEAGTLRAAIDPLGRQTTFEFDERGGLSSIAYADGTREYFEYDPINRMGSHISRDGSRTVRVLDRKGELREIRWSDGTSVHMTVDDGGYLRGVENGHSRIEYAYDGDGRITSEKTAHAEIIYDYDGDGRLAASTPASGDATHYEYDEDGRLVRVKAWGQELCLEYTPSGTVDRLHYGNALSEFQEHDRGGRLSKSRVVDEHGGVISEQRYIYDSCERIVSIVDAQGFHGSHTERRFEYDHGSRLIRDSLLVGDTVAQEICYAYDTCGNMIRDGGASVRIGQMDEIQEWMLRSVSYDALGRITRLPGRQGELECRYGADGTLREVHTQGNSLHFTYDAVGRRISATDGQRTWRFGWSGLQLLWEELQEVPGAPPLRRDYLYLPEGLSPIAFREGERLFWMQHDARGAVIKVFDDAGQIVWKARYGSFGEAHIEIAGVRQPWRLAGQYEDMISGLHYNLGRYYSPLVKTYLSRDPYWFKHGATAYSYCGNDPWNRIDPHGHWAWIAIGAIAGAVIGGVAAALEGKSPLQVAAAALEGAAVGALFAVNPVAGAAAMMALDIVHQGLEKGWSNICIACAAARAALALFGGMLLGRVLGFLGRQLGRLANWAGRKIGRLVRQVSQWIQRWASRPPRGSAAGATTNVLHNTLSAAQATLVRQVEQRLAAIVQQATRNVNSGTAVGRWAQRLYRTPPGHRLHAARRGNAIHEEAFRLIRQEQAAGTLPAGIRLNQGSQIFSPGNGQTYSSM